MANTPPLPQGTARHEFCRVPGASRLTRVRTRAMMLLALILLSVQSPMAGDGLGSVAQEVP